MSRLRLLSKVPETPIEWLADHMRSFLHMPDAAPLYAMLGGLAANILDGPPVWLMFVGAPGSGKTEMLNTMSGIEGLQAVDSIDGPAAFLSGTGKREKARDATGGVLHTLGLHGGLMIKDFTGVLSLDHTRRKLVLDCLRQIYDGKWSRPVGSDGGKMLTWPGNGAYGHVALFAAVTGEIDQHHAVTSSLGERWLYCRFEPSRVSQFSQARQALLNGTTSGWREELRDLVTAFVLSQDMGFGTRIRRRELTNAESVRIARMATVSAMCRSAVSRDPYKHDVIGVPETESYTRLSTQLNQLYLGMEYVTVVERERWRVLAKVALDNMPRMRRMVIQEVVRNKGAGYAQLVSRIGASEAAVMRCVEDLELHGVVVASSKSRQKAVVQLSEFVEREWKWAEWGS